MLEASGTKSAAQLFNLYNTIMALTSNYLFNGITVSQAYVKVKSIVGDKNVVGVDVAFSADSTEQPFTYKGYEFTPDLNGPNFIQQAYEYLKTLPEFADAVDC